MAELALSIDVQGARALRQLRILVPFAIGLAFLVVVLGAYTRLSDAGLGCPDWPGCYGFLAVPDAQHEIAAATERFPHAPVEVHKAWTEMVHRYFAGSLGIVVLGIALLAWRSRRDGAPFGTACALLALIVVQGAFGAWTVTLKLWPQVVTAHLLGGFATLSLLWLLRLQLVRPEPFVRLHRVHAAVALAVLVGQITLGGWTTSNYAALACPDFPTCQTQWWPAMDFRTGFDVTQDVGPNYLGGLMHSQARAAIHVSHRLGALTAFAVIGLLVLRLVRAEAATGRRLGAALAVALIVQMALGITNVVGTLPLGIATAHNAMGAVLLLVLVSVNYRAFLRRAFSRGTMGMTERGTTA